MTLPEVLLWQRLRKQQIGVKFRKQHPIGLYTADFYCAKRKLIIEVDGSAHDGHDRAVRDECRDRYLADNGYDVLRLMVSDILADMDAAISAIVARLESPLHRACGTVPLPVNGEDLL